MTGKDSKKRAVLFDDATGYLPCFTHHPEDEPCDHNPDHKQLLKGSAWNPDGLDLHLQLIRLADVAADIRHDPDALSKSNHWVTAKGVMPVHPLKLYLPIAHHEHKLRFRVKADVASQFRGFEDCTFERVVQLADSTHNLPPLPSWISHLAAVRDDGPEIPLDANRYSIPCKNFWKSAARIVEDDVVESELVAAAVAHCVSISYGSWNCLIIPDQGIIETWFASCGGLSRYQVRVDLGIHRGTLMNARIDLR